MYIVFEGIDTAGKSTQIERLGQNLPHARFTKEPGGTAFGSTIRSIVLNDHALDAQTELLLFLADRREHYIKVVKPLLETRQTLISDRSFISGIAYALGSSRLTLEQLIELNLMTLDHTLPDAVILFHLPESTLRQRLGQKTHDGIEKRGIAYLIEVQAQLIAVTKHLKLNHLLIDASASIETIHDQIMHFITTLKES